MIDFAKKLRSGQELPMRVDSFIREIIQKSLHAYSLSEENPKHSDWAASLSIYLMEGFGYSQEKKGDIEDVQALLKAFQFTDNYVNSRDEFDMAYELQNGFPDSVRKNFASNFNEAEIISLLRHLTFMNSDRPFKELLK